MSDSEHRVKSRRLFDCSPRSSSIRDRSCNSIFSLGRSSIPSAPIRERPLLSLCSCARWRLRRSLLPVVGCAETVAGLLVIVRQRRVRPFVMRIFL